MNEEQYLRERLAELHRAYLRDAQPYIDRLAAIISRRPPPPVIITVEQAERLKPLLRNALDH